MTDAWLPPVDSVWFEKARPGHSVRIVSSAHYHRITGLITIAHLTAHNKRAQGSHSLITTANLLKRYSPMDMPEEIPRVERTLGQQVNAVLAQHRYRDAMEHTTEYETQLADALATLMITNHHTPAKVEGEIIVCNVCVNEGGNPIAWEQAHSELGPPASLPGNIGPWAYNPKGLALNHLSSGYIEQAISYADSTHTWYGTGERWEAKSYASLVASKALDFARGLKR